MDFKDNTGGETMGNKGGDILHSFFHQKDKTQKVQDLGMRKLSAARSLLVGLVSV